MSLKDLKMGTRLGRGFAAMLLLTALISGIWRINQAIAQMNLFAQQSPALI